MLINSDIEGYGFNKSGNHLFMSSEKTGEGKEIRSRWIITCCNDTDGRTSEVKIQESRKNAKGQWMTKTLFDGVMISPAELRTVLMLTGIIDRKPIDHQWMVKATIKQEK